MKKLFLITVLMSLVLNFTAAQETVTVKGEELIIPEDKEQLKQAYVEMAELYLEAEEDLTKTLENNDELITKNKELNKLIDKAQDNTQKAVDNTDVLIGHSETLIQDVNTLIDETEYWMNKKQWVVISPGFMYQNNFIGTEPQIGFGVSIKIMNRFDISTYYLPIDSFSVSLEYQVFSY